MELISWIATGVVLLSFFFEGNKLRLINSLGAILWIIWGVAKEEGAVVFLNIMIVGIHAYKLSIEKKSKTLFRQQKTTKKF
jgi:hypothetical protein